MTSSSTSQPMILQGSKHTSVDTLDFNGAGRDIISPTINFNMGSSTIPRTILRDIMSRLGLTLSPHLTTPANEEDCRREDPTRPALTKEEPVSQATGLGNAKDLPSNAHSRGFEPEDDFATVPIEDWEQRNQEKMTMPQVYVHSMLNSGLGLACWRPRPSSTSPRGVIPGDVGTFTAKGGFKKTFNLWDDQSAIQATSDRSGNSVSYHQTPPRDVELHEAEFDIGHTVVECASSEVIGTADGEPPDSFEFEQRREQPGAVLAFTSSADLEELDDHALLQDHICQHAELFYTHANSIRRIGVDESLYIITGCVKSDSYALAAFQQSMDALDHTLKLVQRTRANITNEMQSSTAAQRPSYMWTRRGTAHTRTGVSKELGNKDQALFFRGFKLKFSPSFRARMKLGHGAGGGGRSVGGGESENPDNRGGDRADNFRPPGTGSVGGPDVHLGAGGSATGGGSDSSYKKEPTNDFRLQKFPSDSFQENCHPCDAINDHVLRTTGADLALSHDDDWRFLVSGAPGNLNETSARSENASIAIQHGVVLLQFDLPPCGPPDSLMSESDSFWELTNFTVSDEKIDDMPLDRSKDVQGSQALSVDVLKPTPGRGVRAVGNIIGDPAYVGDKDNSIRRTASASFELEAPREHIEAPQSLSELASYSHHTPHEGSSHEMNQLSYPKTSIRVQNTHFGRGLSRDQQIMEAFCLEPPSSWAVFCPWTRLSPNLPRDLEVCDELVPLRDLKTHLRKMHSVVQDGSCKMLDTSGNLCNFSCSGKFKRHMLSNSKRHAGPIEGARIVAATSSGHTYGPRERLPRVVCSYCGMSFSMYIGGHCTSLRRHVASRHADAPPSPWGGSTVVGEDDYSSEGTVDESGDIVLASKQWSDLATGTFSSLLQLPGFTGSVEPEISVDETIIMQQKLRDADAMDLDRQTGTVEEWQDVDDD